MSHNRSIEILGPTFHWDGQTSEDKVEVFQSSLDSPPQLRAGWEQWRGRAQHNIMDWNPGMYLPGSEHLRLYCTYFPIIMNRGNNRKLVAFNSNRIMQSAAIISIAPREWMNMPALDFLPVGVDDIIAGAAGLLIVNGGVRPQCRNLDIKEIPPLEQDLVAPPLLPPPPTEGESPPEERKPKYEDFPEQSILVACNPLQRDYHLLPPLGKFKMHNKTAKMVLTNEPAEVGDWRPARPNRRHPDYKLYVLGSEVVATGTRDADSSEITLFTYDSRVDSWTATASIRDARLPPQGRTDIAIVGEGLYFGGQERTDQSVRRKGGKAESTWCSKIFFLEISPSATRWRKLAFSIPDLRKGTNFMKALDCQAPRVMQCRLNGPIYVATRPLDKPNMIQVWELEIYSKMPTGRLKYVTKLPHEYFYVVFGRIESHKAWDCTAGRNYLAFAPAYDETMTEVCLYDVEKETWNFSRRPVETGKMAKYRLARAEWTPFFAAPRPGLRDMRRECACLDRLNPVVFNPVHWSEKPVVPMP